MQKRKRESSGSRAVAMASKSIITPKTDASTSMTALASVAAAAVNSIATVNSIARQESGFGIEVPRQESFSLENKWC